MTDNSFTKEQLSEIKDEIIRISGTNPKACMQCGKCSGTCPSYDDMEFHPHQIVRMVETGDLEKLLKSKSLYRCLSCLACLERCPRQVEPAKIIEAVRTVLERQKGNNHLPKEQIPNLIDGEVPQQLIVSAMRKFVK